MLAVFYTNAALYFMTKKTKSDLFDITIEKYGKKMYNLDNISFKGINLHLEENI